jgi:hypothetical protein
VILLCTNFHGGFDDSIPSLVVIVPTDLQFFIDFEERDYQSRANAESEEEAPCKRRVPTAKEYNEAGGMYRAYAMRGGYNTSAKNKWGGGPAAIILKASLGINIPTLWGEGS